MPELSPPALTPEAWAWPLAISFVAAAAGTAALRWAAPRLGMLDRLDSRKNHPRPMPLLGGLAVYLSVVGACLLARSAMGRLGIRPTALLAASFVVLALGLWDDRTGLRARRRLLIQLVCAAGVIAAGVRFAWFGWLPADCLVSALWLVGLANAMNCLDCADGAAAGVAVIGAGALAVIAARNGHAGTELAALAVLAACVGFWVFNFPPASIFLGDAGSTVLGFLLGGLSIEATQGFSPLTQAWAAALPVAVPVWDIVLVHARRYRAGAGGLRALLESSGHDHLPHRLRRLGLTPRRAALGVYLMAASLAVPAALLAGRPHGTAAMMALTLAALVSGERPFGLVLRQRGSPVPGATRHVPALRLRRCCAAGAEEVKDAN
jgi:UDP-GlcNAc:undecaprenyl-phosphate GlcNAc-1-phosphate transferase